jgi:hypothetical protein
MSEPETPLQLLRHPVRFYVDCVLEWLAHRRGADLLQQTVIFYAYATFLLMLVSAGLLIPLEMFMTGGANFGTAMSTAGGALAGVVIGGTAGLSMTFFAMLNPVARYAMRLERTNQMSSKAYQRCRWVFEHHGWWFAIFMLIGASVAVYFLVR